jgi:hypothetical protein
MVSNGLKRVLGAFVAGSMVFTSTTALASTTTSIQQPSPWAVLTAMSGGASAAAMCGAAQVAAATPAPTGCVLPVLDAPPPVPVAEAPPPLPPVAAPVGGMGISPLLLGLLAIAAGVGIYLAVHKSGHGNSPA